MGAVCRDDGRQGARAWLFRRFDGEPEGESVGFFDPREGLREQGQSVYQPALLDAVAEDEGELAGEERVELERATLP